MEKVTSNISTDPFDIRGTMLTQLKAGYSADLLYAAVLSSSKASTALFYRTITLRSSLWMSYALLATIILCTPIPILLLAVRCQRQPWRDINGNCEALASSSKTLVVSDATHVLTKENLVFPLESYHSN